MPEDRYPKQLFCREWNVKPCRGRQRKILSLVCKWLEDIEREDSSIASFISCVEEFISGRECTF